jgi:hypothetical protein
MYIQVLYPLSFFNISRLLLLNKKYFNNYVNRGASEDNRWHITARSLHGPCTLLHGPARHCTLLHVTARSLHATARHCTVLARYCTSLHVTARSMHVPLRVCTLLNTEVVVTNRHIRVLPSHFVMPVLHTTLSHGLHFS